MPIEIPVAEDFIHKRIRKLQVDEPFTQKARGLVEMAKHFDGFTNPEALPWVYNTILARAKPLRELEHAENALHEWRAFILDFPDSPAPSAFARPCPVHPRHGFVESRVVKTAEELRDLAVETYAEDEKGEIIIMPYYDVPFSFVQSSNIITVGRGHDGVTAGNNSDYIELNYEGINIEFLFSTVLPRATVEVPNKNALLYEGVLHNQLPAFVQSREVPKEVSGGEFIPSDPAVWGETLYKVVTLKYAQDYPPLQLERLLKSPSWLERGTVFYGKTLVSPSWWPA